MKSRVDYIDIAKGIAIILVVYGHVLPGIYNADMPISKSFFHLSDNLVYSFHMPLFFFLSGLFYKSSLEKYGIKGTLKNKIKTILYPYVLWSLIQTGIEIFFSTYTNKHLQINVLYSCLIFPRSQFWFLYALFIISIIDLLIVKLKTIGWVYILAGLSLLYRYLNIDLGVLNSSITFLLYFNLGILSSKLFLSENFEHNFSKLTYLTGFSILFATTSIIAINYKLFKNNTLGCILAISGLLFVIQVSTLLSTKKSINILKKLGKFSLEIYILHIIIASGTRIVLLKLLHVSNITIHILTGTFLGVILPYFFSTALAKYKFYNHLFRIR